MRWNRLPDSSFKPRKILFLLASHLRHGEKLLPSGSLCNDLSCLAQLAFGASNSLRGAAASRTPSPRRLLSTLRYHIMWVAARRNLDHSRVLSMAMIDSRYAAVCLLSIIPVLFHNLSIYIAHIEKSAFSTRLCTNSRPKISPHGAIVSVLLGLLSFKTL